MTDEEKEKEEIEEARMKADAELRRGIKEERRTYVPYGGVDYAPWERHKPITR